MKCPHRQQKSRKPGAIRLRYIFRLLIMVAILQCPHNANACLKDEYYSQNVEGCTECPTAIDDCERQGASDIEECKTSCRNGEL